MATTKKDYEILGVKKSASAEEIRKAFRKLALPTLLMIWLSGAAISQDSYVNGTVRDAEGRPIPDVSVIAYHHSPAGGTEDIRAKTDEQGRFELKNVGRVVFFAAPKFETLTRIRGVGDSALEVSLKPELVNRWPATCSANPRSGRRYGSMFLFLIPQGTKLKHHHGTDTWDLEISFPHSKSSELLTLWSGPMLGDGFVPEESILEASSFTQQGFDWKGKSRDGQNWRWFSSYQDLIHYEHASDDAAHFFDRIMDSVCVRPLPQSPEKR